MRLRRAGIADDSQRFQGLANLPEGEGAAWGDITGTLADQTDLQTALNAKQATLVAGTNIKTVNGTSLLGSGDIAISGSGLTEAQVRTRAFLRC